MSAVKALQQWCRVQCQGYRDVSITNMTTSFRDGLAFCALIHKHRPDLINFDSLKKENVYDNNKLAFRVAEEKLGIPALLDAEDMVALQIPDRLSILTYVSQYYNYFHGRSPIGGMGGIKRPAEGSTEEPSGKKNQPVVSKVFPSSRPAEENNPPSLSKTTKPPPHTRNATQEVLVEKTNQTGTLSNKCVSCNKHVHLVQRHLVDGKLYHRSCAKSMMPASKTAPFRDLPSNTSVSKPTPTPDSSKTPSQTSSRLGPTWLTEKRSASPTFSTTVSSSPPSQLGSSLSSASKESQASLISKPTTSESTITTTTSVTITRPTPAPRTSTTAAKTVQSKLKFFQSDNTISDTEKKATNTDVKRGTNVTGAVQQATAGQAVTIVVNDGGVGKKNENLNTVEVKTKIPVVSGDSGKVSENSKTKAAAFISRKLAEENNNENKPSWANVALKKTEKPSQVETPKKETEGVRGRVRLKVDRSLLADLHTPHNANAAPISVPSRLGSRSPDSRASQPSSSSPSTSAAENESPADWRSMLKPVSKETRAVSPSPSKPRANGAGTSQAQDLSGPSPSLPAPRISVTPPAPRGALNGCGDLTSGDTKSESRISKSKHNYISQEDIFKELQGIEDNLNELEKKGVELEGRLRACEEDGEDDSLMDELMVEWFNLIRNKQVAMRRESELVYIGKTQELEEQQPSVEQELRRLMEKPEHLKTAWQRKREEQLMAKLVEIVNDRNAIIEGLDEDRLREEEEDEQLNKMMKNFNVKKDKAKKKSPMSKLFNWGNKKEG